MFPGLDAFVEINQTGAAGLVDFFPALRSLPDFANPVAARAKKMHEAEKVLYLRLWLDTKAAVKNGTAKPCFGHGLVEAQEKEGFS